MGVTEVPAGIKIFNAPGEEDLTGVISATYTGAMRVAQELWGLPSPHDCRIYVMTSWQRFFFKAAPWYLRTFLVSSYPFWAPRARRLWPYAGAWTQLLGGRVVIGIKPPRLLAASDRSVGAMIYVGDRDLSVKMGQLICHELMHACSAHLRLPAWLNEGIAMLGVDRWQGQRTIREDTLELLRTQPPRCEPPGYRQSSRLDVRGLATHTVRGYWLVNLMEDTEPGFFKRFFSSRLASRQIVAAMAERLGLSADHFWQQIDDLIITQG